MFLIVVSDSSITKINYFARSNLNGSRKNGRLPINTSFSSREYVFVPQGTGSIRLLDIDLRTNGVVLTSGNCVDAPWEFRTQSFSARKSNTPNSTPTVSCISILRSMRVHKCKDRANALWKICSLLHKTAHTSLCVL